MTGSNDSSNTINDLLLKLIGQLGTLGVTGSPNMAQSGNLASVVNYPSPATFHIASGLPTLLSSRRPTWLYINTGQPPTQAQPVSTIGQPTAPAGSTGPTVTSDQATTLPHAFTVGTLHDPATGACNMDT
ncbi:hypothetical protein Tco_1126636, partial [Tanacetum coccineum]